MTQIDGHNLDKQHTPLVSVVMAVRNGMPYLPEAVESILTQTMPDFELIVVNDGSTDDSQRYLERVTDSRLRVVSQPNAGQGASANRGMALARGKYIARMDADDVSLPTRLERQVQFLAANPELALIGAQLRFVSNGRTVEAPRMPQTHGQIVRSFHEGRVGLSQACIMCDATLAKKTPYRIAGSGEDVDFVLRLAEKGKSANLAEVLYLYRIHPQSASLRAAAEVRRGTRFAIQAAQARRSGEPEPKFDDFCGRWSRRARILRILDRIDDCAVFQYRESIIERAAGNRLRGLVRLCAAGACRPATGACRLMQLVRRLLRPHAGQILRKDSDSVSGYR
jgi:glycosyltransferase involved in cell wall biosynthesis